MSSSVDNSSDRVGELVKDALESASQVVDEHLSLMDVGTDERPYQQLVMHYEGASIVVGEGCSRVALHDLCKTMLAHILIEAVEVFLQEILRGADKKTNMEFQIPVEVGERAARAIAMASEMLNDDKRGNALPMICQDFLDMNGQKKGDKE